MPDDDRILAAILTAGVLAAHERGRWTGQLKRDVKYCVDLYRLMLDELRDQEAGSAPRPG